VASMPFDSPILHSRHRKICTYISRFSAFLSFLSLAGLFVGKSRIGDESSSDSEQQLFV